MWNLMVLVEKSRLGQTFNNKNILLKMIEDLYNSLKDLFNYTD